MKIFYLLDIVDGKEKIILSVIWALICRYQLHQYDPKATVTATTTAGAKVNVKDRLLYWARKTLRSDDEKGNRYIQVRDFSESWQDGVAFCALVEKLKPGLINLSEINPVCFIFLAC